MQALRHTSTNSSSLSCLPRFLSSSLVHPPPARPPPLRHSLTNSAMVPAPKRVDSVEVHNTTDKTLTVTVAYDNHKDKTEELDTAEVAAGATHLFPVKNLDMGSWTAVAPIKHISIPGATKLEPNVSGVVNKLSVVASAHGATVQLKQQ